MTNQDLSLRVAEAFQWPLKWLVICPSWQMSRISSKDEKFSGKYTKLIQNILFSSSLQKYLTHLYLCWRKTPNIWSKKSENTRLSLKAWPWPQDWESILKNGFLSVHRARGCVRLFLWTVATPHQASSGSRCAPGSSGETKVEKIRNIRRWDILDIFHWRCLGKRKSTTHTVNWPLSTCRSKGKVV